MSRSEIDDKLEAIIDFSEVRDFIDTPVKRYSSGMYVKLAFSVASHLTSEIVIMDEVLAVGDAAFQKKCIEKMRSAAEDENRTVLYVSHNMDTVRRLCDRCIVLSAGRIVYDGETEEAIRYYHSSLLSANESAGRISDIARRGKDLSGICRIEALEIVSATVSSEDPVRFNMRLHSREDISNVFLRLILSNSSGTILGMTATSPFEVKKGEAVFSFSFPVNELAPGGYVCDFAVISFDGSFQIRHDFLSKVMSFEVAETQLFFGIPWRISSWGSIRLSPINVSRIETAALPDSTSVQRIPD
jgi:lipopolysaccharide transport system ATP-binding protein